MGIEMGSTVTVRIKPTEADAEPIDITFTIVGIVDRNSDQAGVADTLQAPIGSVPDS